MEDNVVLKAPHSKTLPWHQDFSYWPLAQPSAITVWIALDHVTAANGAMQIIPGSHLFGERLPVSFGDAKAFMQEERPGVQEVPQDPNMLGHKVITYELKPGECGFHSALVWHGSTPNTHSRIRCAFVLRYLASGTIWLGAARFPYDDIGCQIGEAVSDLHFPAVKTAF
jgi:ectoine hydroxylase-related dioxygenase (phytanoyl-CoA dioxygenase family)